MTRLLIDAHLDIGWNALSFNREQTVSVDELNRTEEHMTDVRCRGKATTTLPELQRSGVAVCVATLLARGGPDRTQRSLYLQTNLDFHSQAIAHASAQGQLAYYRLMERQGHMKMLRTADDLARHWTEWQDGGNASRPIGYILSMEGADPIVEPSYLEDYWDQGLRAIGPAHYGRSHYAYGTGVSGPLSDKGVELLREMDRLGMLLDVTHLCDESMYQAFDLFRGPVLASHHNCRTLVPGDRQLADEQIQILIERGAVIGAALDAWMLKPDWVRGESNSEGLTLHAVADHTDHICQLAGNAKHVAIGTDLDGGFGHEQTPADLKNLWRHPRACRDLPRSRILRCRHRRHFSWELVAVVWYCLATVLSRGEFLCRSYLISANATACRCSAERAKKSRAVSNAFQIASKSAVSRCDSSRFS